MAADDWHRWPNRIECQMDHLLDFFAQHNITATLFILGYVAKHHPDLIKRCAAAGHEIASHGSNHHRIHHLTPEQFRKDVQSSKARLEDLVGSPVLGYRAPTWSITQDTLWALDILLDLGFAYDSSIFPTRHPQYGIPDAPIIPNHRTTPADREILEIPPLVWQFAGKNLPVAGGGYFRQFPLKLMRLGLEQAAAQNRPAVLYFHPWEFDTDLPRLPLPRLSRIRTYRGINRATAKLQTICSQNRQYLPMNSLIPQNPAQIAVSA
ncbi:XrtA system polysaccharide deacetylase [Poriferisphaera sp. WC338]|uniref:XrtA system polysaccharide deacetylase n=1 Tax=Poriferisphaera sp. WC338 TaxID=3425129 RepID=UPI003D81A652